MLESKHCVHSFNWIFAKPNWMARIQENGPHDPSVTCPGAMICWVVGTGIGIGTETGTGSGFFISVGMCAAGASNAERH